MSALKLRESSGPRSLKRTGPRTGLSGSWTRYGRGTAEGLGHAPRLADEGGAGLVGHVEPLVRVGRDGVGPLEALEQRLELRRDRGQRPVGPVHVEPEALGGAQVGQLVERVDGAGVHGAGVAHDDRGLPAGLPVVGDRPLQQVHADAEAVVGRDLPQLLPADAEEVHGLVHAVVDLVRHVDDQRRRSREAVLAHAWGLGAPGRREGGEVRHRAARGEQALRRLRQAEDLGEPGDDAPLHVDGRVVSAPAVAVHRRGEVVGRGADGVGGGVDEGEEARVRVAEGVGEDAVAHGVEHRLERLAVLGQRLVEEGRGVAHLAEDRPLQEAGAVVGHEVGRPVAQAAHRLGVEIEVVHALPP